MTDTDPVPIQRQKKRLSHYVLRQPRVFSKNVFYFLQIFTFPEDTLISIVDEPLPKV